MAEVREEDGCRIVLEYSNRDVDAHRGRRRTVERRHDDEDRLVSGLLRESVNKVTQASRLAAAADSEHRRQRDAGSRSVG